MISEAVLLYFERKIVVSGAKNVLAYRIPDLVRSPLIANNSSTSHEYPFAFRDQGQYNKLLKKVITAYQQKKISQTQAYKILETANKYVKTQVNPRLYPQDNLRKQVSKLIGFNYAID